MPRTMTEDEAASAFYLALIQPSLERLQALKSNRLKVAHYTTAANAMNIIGGKSLWLRNAELMNDFLELGYGKACLLDALERTRDALARAIDQVHKGLFAEVLQLLDQNDPIISTQTYLTSFAEIHEDDELGRLSMWRAYGGPIAGAAIVFNTDVFESDTELNVFSHPVTYGVEEFGRNYDATLQGLYANLQLLAALPRERAKTIIYNTLQDMVLTTKHHGFHEEREWRAIYSPFRLGSNFVKLLPQTIGGMPQVVFEIPLQDQPDLGLPELELDRLVHRVIVGPSRAPRQVGFALHELMVSKGLTNPAERIKLSEIPLRQQG